LQAAGFDVNCTTTSQPFDLISHDLSNNQTSQGATIFSAVFGWDAETPTSINFSAAWKNTSYCAGEITLKNCTMRAATTL